MTRGYCAGEPGFFDRSEFTVVGATEVHAAGPWHRTLDGATIQMDGEHPVLDGHGEPVVSLDALVAPDFGQPAE